MKDLLSALKRIADKVTGMNSSELGRDLKIEIVRLEKWSIYCQKVTFDDSI
jgi:hypothetical protein